MKKSEELRDAKSCFNRARHDEYVFVLLERDAAAPATIRFWVEERIRLGRNLHTDPQIVSALRDADLIEASNASIGHRQGPMT